MNEKLIWRIINSLLIVISVVGIVMLLVLPNLTFEYKEFGENYLVTLSGPASIFGGQITEVFNINGHITSRVVTANRTNPLAIISLFMIIVGVVLLIIRTIKPELFKNPCLTFIPAVLFLVAGTMLVLSRDAYMTSICSKEEIEYYKSINTIVRIGVGPVMGVAMCYIVGSASLIESVTALGTKKHK